METVIVTGTAPLQGIVQATPNYARTVINNSDVERLIRQRDFVPRGGNVGGSDDLTRLLQKEFTPRGGNLPEVKVTATKAKKFLKAGGRALSRIAAPISLITMANDMAMGILNWNKRNFAGGAKPPPPQTPKKTASSLPSGVSSNASPYDEVFVVSRRRDQFPSGDGKSASGQYPVRPSGRTTPRISSAFGPSGQRSASRSPGGSGPSLSDILTSFQQPGLASAPKTKTSPKPKLPTNDQCVRERKPRPKCPARGYKLICKQWSKKSCQ